MSYDLIICSDILYYVPGEDLVAGIRELAARLGGVAFLKPTRATKR